MSNDDPLARLEAANPYPANGSVNPTRAREALFQEITMHDYLVNPTTTNPAKPQTVPWWRRPRAALPALAAITAIAIAVVAITSTVTAKPASALVVDAAKKTAAFDSGRVKVTIDLTEIPRETISGTATMDYRYANGDTSFVYDASLLNVDGSDSALNSKLDIRSIGDTTYSSYEPGKFLRTQRAPQTTSTESLFDFNTTEIAPDTIVGLLETTRDFKKVSTEADATLYQGNIALSDLRAIGAQGLPAGLSLLVGENDAASLPAELGIQVTVVDSLLSKLVVQIDGPTPNGSAKATITSTFGEFGEPQPIVAPPAEQVVDGLEPQLSPEMKAALAVLDELSTRRPGLCSEMFSEDIKPSSTEQVNDQFAAFAEVSTRCRRIGGGGSVRIDERSQRIARPAPPVGLQDATLPAVRHRSGD